MKTKFKSFLFIIFALIFTQPITAQKMKVESMELVRDDLTANLSENLHKDLNGDYGGLVKVYLAVQNAVFEGVVLEQKLHSPSEYWVFMAKGSNRLKVTVPGYLPLEVNFRDYENCIIKSKLTYVLTITLPPNPSPIIDDPDPIVNTTSKTKETFTVNDVSFTMVRVVGGTFAMGATEEQGNDAYTNEKPTHKVTISTFSIGETEVTEALWVAVMGSNTSFFKDSPDKPMVNVSWMECQEFIKKLNSITGKSFRLPTEAEWEYAARGGNKSRHYKYSGGNNPNEVAWLDSNSGGNTHPVKTKSPNELGIYDMSGNVWEWCMDLYDDYSSSPQTNPTGASTGTKHINRGGSWDNNARNCRVSYRSSFSPAYRSYFIGLRLAL